MRLRCVCVVQLVRACPRGGGVLGPRRWTIHTQDTSLASRNVSEPDNQCPLLHRLCCAVRCCAVATLHSPFSSVMARLGGMRCAVLRRRPPGQFGSQPYRSLVRHLHGPHVKSVEMSSAPVHLSAHRPTRTPRPLSSPPFLDSASWVGPQQHGPMPVLNFGSAVSQRRLFRPVNVVLVLVRPGGRASERAQASGTYPPSPLPCAHRSAGARIILHRYIVQARASFAHHGPWIYKNPSLRSER